MKYTGGTIDPIFFGKWRMVDVSVSNVVGLHYIRNGEIGSAGRRTTHQKTSNLFVYQK